jgi:DNA-binding NarL/FixJ family response regulator
MKVGIEIKNALLAELVVLHLSSHGHSPTFVTSEPNLEVIVTDGAPSHPKARHVRIDANTTLAALDAQLASHSSAVRSPSAAYDSAIPLTARQLAVARLVAAGLSNRSIAEATDLREQSVKNLVSQIMDRLGCRSRVEVALKLAKPGTSTTS